MRTACRRHSVRSAGSGHSCSRYRRRRPVGPRVTPPRCSQVRADGPMRRFALVLCGLPGCGAIAGVEAHFLFTECYDAGVREVLPPRQKVAAQQRQFLHRNGISSTEGQIGSDGVFGSRSGGIHPRKCEYAESHFLLESGKDELHGRCSLWNSSHREPPRGVSTNAGCSKARIQKPGYPGATIVGPDRTARTQSRLVVVSWPANRIPAYE